MAMSSAQQLASAATHAENLRQALRADLGFYGASGKEATHSWHPFPAKFPPQLPRFFIEHLSEEGEVVLDPMSGSGTTLVEALRLKRRAVGCDIDPLARAIAEAKTAPVSAEAAAAGEEIIALAENCLEKHRSKLAEELLLRYDEKSRAFIDYWFLPQQQMELLALLQGVESVGSRDEKLWKFFKMVFSSSIIAKSGGASLARDLAHTRPHKVADKKPNSALAEFRKRLKQNLAAGAGDLKFQFEAEIHAASAASTPLRDASVDLIVTSPPYANNAIDYMRAHKFSLVWFGWTVAELAKLRAKYLGHDAANGAHFEHLPPQCEKTVQKLSARDKAKAAALRRYFGEMSGVVAEMRRVLKRGRAAIIVVGSSNLRGVDVETQKGIAAIGENEGFELAGIGVRQLDRDKRMMPARWGKKGNSQIEERMHEEHVIGLIKQ